MGCGGMRRTVIGMSANGGRDGGKWVEWQSRIRADTQTAAQHSPRSEFIRRLVLKDITISKNAGVIGQKCRICARFPHSRTGLLGLFNDKIKIKLSYRN